MFLVLAAQGYPALAQLRARFLALWAPRVLMPPMGKLAQLMAQLVLGLRLPRMGGYLPAAQHGLLFQLPARPGQARLAQGRLGRVGLELQAPWLRRRRKITQPHQTLA